MPQAVPWPTIATAVYAKRCYIVYPQLLDAGQWPNLDAKKVSMVSSPYCANRTSLLLLKLRHKTEKKTYAENIFPAHDRCMQRTCMCGGSWPPNIAKYAACGKRRHVCICVNVIVTSLPTFLDYLFTTHTHVNVCGK